MLSNLLIAALSSFAVVQAASNVVAVFLIGREGDRTSEVQGNTQLTTLGKNQVFNTASYFRSRYLNSSSPDFIENVDIDYLYNQIYAAAPYVPSHISV
jgi:prostatic aicd phosphatase